jgi:hypothetical protein
MAIDSLFERGTLHDWREFARALRNDAALARNALLMCERNSNPGSAALARTLVEHFHPQLSTEGENR